NEMSAALAGFASIFSSRLHPTTHPTPTMDIAPNSIARNNLITSSLPTLEKAYIANAMHVLAVSPTFWSSFSCF
ncbi:hypothetical protein, partial [Lysobacter enzymogenes]|uniref:hypothetical protein n=1 Tax=Lysobacter enzymogenes TaxID=69 RepID=UPI00197C2858